MPKASSIIVPFYGSNLIVVDHHGEPYVPMKPIVEGMRMDWSYQLRKLNNDSKRWGVAVIAIPTLDKHNAFSCVPLRKLFGWLQTIHPKRVNPEIRHKITQISK